MNVFILGASSSIAKALIKKIKKENPSCFVLGTSRSESCIEELDYHLVLDVSKDEDWQRASSIIESKGIKFDLVLSCVGLLTDEERGVSPEKSLREISVESFFSVFSVNTFSFAMLAKMMKKHILKSEESMLACLSAMVGSISENEIGGWYSYRSSKAALNMILKNVAIEFSRSGMKCKVLSLHPGTTLTPLSENYLKGVGHRVFSTDETADNLLGLIKNKVDFETGSFINWDHRVIGW